MSMTVTIGWWALPLLATLVVIGVFRYKTVKDRDWLYGVILFWTAIVAVLVVWLLYFILRCALE